MWGISSVKSSAFSAGSDLCLRAVHLVGSHPAHIRCFHRMLNPDSRSSLLSQQVKSCQAQLHPTHSVFITSWAETSSSCFSRFLIFWKDGWIFPNVGKEEGGEAFSNYYYHYLFLFVCFIFTSDILGLMKNVSITRCLKTCALQLIPLVGIMAFAATGATTAALYFLFTKPDVMWVVSLLLYTLLWSITFNYIYSNLTFFGWQALK